VCTIGPIIFFLIGHAIWESQQGPLVFDLDVFLNHTQDFTFWLSEILRHYDSFLGHAGSIGYEGLDNHME